MVSWLITDMGGAVPRKDSRLLPDSAAEAAWNTDLDFGTLQGLRVPVLTIDLSASPGTVQRAYRIPASVDQAEVWLPLPSPFSSVVPSPLTNDTSQRYYWTNPSDGAYFSTYALIAAGTAPYNLGFIGPALTTAGTPTVTASGGTTNGTLPLIDRAYLYTFVDIFGLESSPSEPSAIVSGAPDGTWAIGNLPSNPPGPPAGVNYPAVRSLRLYRTEAGATTGDAFFQVAELYYDPGAGQAAVPAAGSSYEDTVPDTTVTEQPELITATYLPPPQGLDGLIEMPGGMLVGFTGNTLHFCEPYLPHAWPAGYDIAVENPIVGLGVWQQTLFIATEGAPYSASGSTPASVTASVIRTPEPCISRGSIVADLAGVTYASPNGLVQLSYYGAQNITAMLFSRNQWIDNYIGYGIISCRHRTQYLALNLTANSGFLINSAEGREGVVNINSFMGAVAIWNDVYTAKTYIMVNKVVYEWDPPGAAQPLLTYRWRSKQFSLANAASLGACQVLLDPTAPAAAAAALPTNPLADTTDTNTTLPVGCAALVTIFAAEAQVLQVELTAERTMFRLPSGFKAFDWQVDIIARVPTRRIELASSMRELRRV